MKIRWLGHSCFLITSDQGTRIITDPFTAGKGIGLEYKEVTLAADIVTSSHGHADHNNTAPIKGSPVILTDPTDSTVKDIKIHTVRTWHDENEGKQRGPNLVFCFEVDGVKVCHMGDLGHKLGKAQIDEIGKVDVVCMPVGGVFTLDCEPAMRTCESLRPSIIIPMHYKTEYCGWLKWTADDFVKGRSNYRKLDTDELEIKAGSLPKAMEIIILKYRG